MLDLAGPPDTLAAGRPGKVGLLELRYARVGDRTELVDRYQKSPLQIMRPLYIDPQRPDLPVTYLMSTGGGIIQADRNRMDIDCGPGTAVHLTTQAATKVHRMEFDHATQVVNLAAGEGSYVEYLPDALIPYRDARFYQQTRVTVDPTATVLLSETIAAGRLARGERHAYRLLFSDLEIQRPDGTLLALDTVRLDPHGSGPVTGPAVFADHDLMATLYAVTPLAPAAEVADILHEALLTTGLAFGVSTLPDDCGAWVRVVSSDSPALTRAMRVAWDALRRLLIGVPAPDLRKT
ncbi:urease accessory protein UreD [Streptomyces sp. NBC_01387]|uniref:urease accessory protein UreD n=1 Tax=unclassified Streptomyces TaxID=2593676 RepID=UPI002252D7BD|nr:MULTISPECIES: urease accessory protein UreD [unclassified Streptomyces]MCX4553322.1 urease accessory protein UreD [Streptomyces sp. NBC_01500]WSC24468.1 urease accessory protein UreD [Streptomyces sp. NBC_01766]WSV58446.1 urease accessory protein UreD [Streptomyces sp. NBC_01014]